MLTDWLERAFGECPLHLRDMGYLNEMLGIRQRRRRFQQAWSSHCQQSREVILAAARRCTAKHRAVVIGTGWLHDVPLKELTELFEEVLLVDLFHPRSVHWRVRNHPRVRLLRADITGTLEAVWRAAEIPGSALPTPIPGYPGDEEPADLTVSLNILSQLPCKPERYLRQRGHHSREAIYRFCQSLIVSHLHYLRCRTGVVTLIADRILLTFDASGKEIRREPTLYEVAFPFQDREWIWELVPRQEHYPHHAEHLLVSAVEDIHQPILCAS